MKKIKKEIKDQRVTFDSLTQVATVFDTEHREGPDFANYQGVRFTHCNISFSILPELNVSNYTSEFRVADCDFVDCSLEETNNSKCINFIRCNFYNCIIHYKDQSSFCCYKCNFKVKFDAYNRIGNYSNFDHISFRNCNLSGLLGNSSIRYLNLDYEPNKEIELKDGVIMEDKIISLICPLKCPEEGSFIGWKKICTGKDEHYALCKLEIPKDALRLSGNGNKCRASKAKVLDIEDIEYDNYLTPNGKKNKKGHSIHVINFIYEVGKIVECTKAFDLNRLHECSSGIHFFISKQEAIDY